MPRRWYIPAPVLEDVRAYYRKILPFYEKESGARARLVFWRSLARRRRPRRILEIGSGLGRITGVLAHQAPTIGLDISFDMLGRASHRVRGRSRARFVAADVRDAIFGPRFDLIVAPSDPFCHLTKIDDRRRALRQVARQLSTRGRFVLEGLHRRREFDYPERRIAYPGGVLLVQEAWSPVDRRRDLWRAAYRYRDRGARKSEKRLEASFLARAWNPREIRRLFRSCGLVVEELWGDFDRGPFRAATSKKLIVVARRRARFVHRNRTGERKKR